MMRYASRTSFVLRTALAVGLTLAGAARAEESTADLVRRGFTAAATQYGGLLSQVQSKPGFPRTVENGAVKLVGPHDWTSGFFPGSLWYLFEATGDAKWRAAAIDYTARTAPVKFDKTQHDLGFMLGAGYG
ncbi:MAG TPA: hypothetical protein VIT92_00145, partial [Burkholderiaceae bacterium]